MYQTGCQIRDSTYYLIGLIFLIYLIGLIII